MKMIMYLLAQWFPQRLLLSRIIHNMTPRLYIIISSLWKYKIFSIHVDYVGCSLWFLFVWIFCRCLCLWFSLTCFFFVLFVFWTVVVLFIFLGNYVALALLLLLPSLIPPRSLVSSSYHFVFSLFLSFSAIFSAYHFVSFFFFAHFSSAIQYMLAVCFVKYIDVQFVGTLRGFFLECTCE